MTTTGRLSLVVMTMTTLLMAAGLFAQTPADVAGDWALMVDTDAGPTTPSVVLEQDGTELTGHYSSETLGEADVTGSGNEVQFSFSASAQGFDVDVSYTGTLQDDGTLSGQISLGDLGGGTFTGKRR
jgi:hypothetical protein